MPTPRRKRRAARASVPAYTAQLATLVEEPPDGEGWLHEQKYDGYRIGAALEAGRVRLWSRRAQEWTAELSSVADAVAALPARSALFDGEVAVVLPSGVTSFQALQQRTARTALVYFVFDLLHLDGEDLAPLPLEERKRRLRALMGGHEDGVRYSDHVVGGGAAFHHEACRLGLEGMVSKRRDAPHRAGRNLDWRKIKCGLRQELVVGGFTEPEGARAGVGALLVGYYEGKHLRWAGKVGTGAGWTATFLTDLRKKLERLRTDEPPFDPPVAESWLRRHARWVRPALVAEVRFAEWTSDGRVRHASVQGLRADKRPEDVRRERPAALTTPPATEIEIAGVRISHPDRVLYPDLGLTKADLARYYDAVADRMLPHVQDRPLTLLRCARAIDPALEKGGCTMIKHAKAWGPLPLRRVRIQELHKTGEYLVAADRAGLVSLAQMGVVEIHTWNGRAGAPDEHDRVVFDLDPGPKVPWARVVAAAYALREQLEERRLRAWVKTTGGKGLHLVVPIARTPWDVCLAFARGVAEALVRTKPRAYTVALPKTGRADKIFVDVLRNGRANTAVAAFSARARGGATVSMPISWDDLAPSLDPAAFTIARVVRDKRADPWREYWRARQRLPG